jgi:hypothetical protein
MAAWAAQREIIVVLTAPRGAPREGAVGAPPDRSRIRGYVRSVAATAAFALLWDGTGDSHVPLALVRSVRKPHFNAPEDGTPVVPPPPREVVILYNQLSLF